MKSVDETLKTVLSDLDAARFLLLTDEGRTDSAAVQALDRIVKTGDLNPCLIGGKRRYTLKELCRYVDDATDNYRVICKAKP